MNAFYATRKSLVVVSVLLVFFGGSAGIAETYDARIADKEILTPRPGPAPRINGPKIYGAQPASHSSIASPARECGPSASRRRDCLRG